MAKTTIDPSTFDNLKQMGDADFIRELIDTFLDDAPHMLKELSQALAARNAELFRRTAHSLKSNSNTFGALALAELSKDLELMGRDNRLEAVGDKLEKLAVEYARVETALKGMRNA